MYTHGTKYFYLWKIKQKQIIHLKEDMYQNKTIRYRNYWKNIYIINGNVCMCINWRECCFIDHWIWKSSFFVFVRNASKTWKKICGKRLTIGLFTHLLLTNSTLFLMGLLFFITVILLTLLFPYYRCRAFCFSSFPIARYWFWWHFLW